MDHINGFKAAVAAVLGCLTALWGWFGWLVVAWVACMLLDYATGTAAALKAGKWSCKAAREGLWHKVGAMAAVLVAAILDGVLGLILDHIPALTLPFDYTVFLTVLVLVWYILTELGSIVENAGRLGAPLPAWLSKAIAALESGVDSTGDKLTQTSVYKGYKQDKIEMRGDRAEMSDFPLYLNTVAGGLDCRNQTIGGFSFVVKIYAVPVIEIIG